RPSLLGWWDSPPSNIVRGLVQIDVKACSRLYYGLAIFDVNQEIRGCLPHSGNRQLDSFIDVTLQEASTVSRIEAFLGQQIERRLSDLDRFALPLHLAPQLIEVESGNLPDLVHRQRREDYD